MPRSTVDQSAITGESMPLEKRKSDLVFSGSMIRKGGSHRRCDFYGCSHIFWQNSTIGSASQTKVAYGNSHLGINEVASNFSCCFAFCGFCCIMDTWLKPVGYVIFGVNFVGVSNTRCSSHNVHSYNGAWITGTRKERSLWLHA